MADETPHALADPTSWVFGLTSTAVLGVLPLLDDSGLNARQRRASRVVTAAIGGLYLAITVGGRRVPVQAAVGLTAAVATLGTADLADRVDARVEARLRRAGLRHPRWWMAAGMAAVTFAGFMGDRAAARHKQLEAVEDDRLAEVARPD